MPSFLSHIRAITKAAPRRGQGRPPLRSEAASRIYVPYRQRDALLVSLIAYAGLRPGELRALRLADVREGTILVQRAADPDGLIKPTKTAPKRAVRLLSPLAQDLRERRLTIGRPPDSAPLLANDDRRPWDKSAWQMWRADRWAPACGAVGLDPVRRPYDLRHGFASLLLAEGRQPLCVAKQHGHSLTVLGSTYAHLIDQYAERTEQVDAEAEIAKARASERALEVRRADETLARSGVRQECVGAVAEAEYPLCGHQKTPLIRGFREVPLRGFEPRFPP